MRRQYEMNTNCLYSTKLDFFILSLYLVEKTNDYLTISLILIESGGALDVLYFYRYNYHWKDDH